MSDDKKKVADLAAIRTEVVSLTPSYHEGQVLRRAFISMVDHIGGAELAETLAAENPNAASGAPAQFGSSGGEVMAPGSISGPGAVVPQIMGGESAGAFLTSGENGGQGR